MVSHNMIYYFKLGIPCEGIFPLKNNFIDVNEIDLRWSLIGHDVIFVLGIPGLTIVQ